MRRKFWQRNKTESGSDAAKALEQSNPYVFKDAVADVHNNHGGGDVWIMKKKTRAGTPTKKGEMDVADVFAHDNFLQYAQDTFGDGLYVLRIFQKNSKKVHSDHHFALGEIPDATAKAKKDKKEGGTKSLERDLLQVSSRLL